VEEVQDREDELAVENSEPEPRCGSCDDATPIGRRPVEILLGAPIHEHDGGTCNADGERWANSDEEEGRCGELPESNAEAPSTKRHWTTAMRQAALWDPVASHARNQSRHAAHFGLQRWPQCAQWDHVLFPPQKPQSKPNGPARIAAQQPFLAP
jgi:hypothetical protein